MEYQTITLDISEGIAQITLNRPEKMNALNGQMRTEITHAIKATEGEARVIVLTGAGSAFCSGQDLGDAGNANKIDVERTLRDEYEPLLWSIHDCPLPIIAAVNGPAAGAGASLALAADVVIASESAYFVQAFTLIGLMPDAGGTYWLPRNMGSAKAMGAALFADRITARQADDWGMIWEAVTEDVFDAHWRARAAHLAQGPGFAYTALKQSLRQSWDNDLRGQLALESRHQGACAKSRDFKEGVVAFLEKRPARYEGR